MPGGGHSPLVHIKHLRRVSSYSVSQILTPLARDRPSPPLLVIETGPNPSWASQKSPHHLGHTDWGKDGPVTHPGPTGVSPGSVQCEPRVEALHFLSRLQARVSCGHAHWGQPASLMMMPTCTKTQKTDAKGKWKTPPMVLESMAPLIPNVGDLALPILMM